MLPEKVVAGEKYLLSISFIDPQHRYCTGVFLEVALCDGNQQLIPDSENFLVSDISPSRELTSPSRPSLSIPRNLMQSQSWSLRSAFVKFRWFSQQPLLLIINNFV
jgi:hypothetical protein